MNICLDWIGCDMQFWIPTINNPDYYAVCIHTNLFYSVTSISHPIERIREMFSINVHSVICMYNGCRYGSLAYQDTRWETDKVTYVITHDRAYGQFRLLTNAFGIYRIS